MDKDALLKVKGLEVRYLTSGAEIKAVDDVAIQIGAQECAALIGESGSGKSTIANAILRVLPGNSVITQGEIFFKGRSLLALTEKQMQRVRGKEISIVFQDPHSFLNPVLKIGEQLTETIRTHYPHLGREKIAERAIEIISLVRIPDPSKILDRYPHQLSGGMAQRVTIALALSSNPALIIADEPTSALDLTVQAQMIKLLKSLSEMFHLSVLLITHDLSLVSNIAQRAYVMYRGKIVEEDQIEGLYHNPKHPYTALLIEAVKKLQGTEASSALLVKSKEDSDGPLCKFLPQCPKSQPVCKETPPRYVHFPGGKRVLCIGLGKKN